MKSIHVRRQLQLHYSKFCGMHQCISAWHCAHNPYNKTRLHKNNGQSSHNDLQCSPAHAQTKKRKMSERTIATTQEKWRAK